MPVACGATDVAEASDPLPHGYDLIQNYPNPFNPATDIGFRLPTASQVKLEVYNIAGQKVATPISGPLEAGDHTVAWNSSGNASGLYLYRLMAGDFAETKKMLLLK